MFFDECVDDASYHLMSIMCSIEFPHDDQAMIVLPCTLATIIEAIPMGIVDARECACGKIHSILTMEESAKSLFPQKLKGCLKENFYPTMRPEYDPVGKKFILVDMTSEDYDRFTETDTLIHSVQVYRDVSMNITMIVKI